MTFADTAWQLSELIDGARSVYMRTDPEYPDFTVKSPFRLEVWNLKRQIELEVSPSDVARVVGLLDCTIFDRESVPHLYTWNFKSFASYFRYFCSVPKFVTPSNSLIDLKPIENFLGVRKKSPENLVEAINRTKVAAQNTSWQSIYKAIHLPLSLRVLPSIETTGILNEQTRKAHYPCYEIEGQTNGRMNCYDQYVHCYLPHTLSQETKQHLKLEGHGYRFVAADFRFCEVVVLQWLSGDETLKTIMDSGEDLHSRIYEIVTEDKCDTQNKRSLSKRMFLPVMYGCGPGTLASNLGVSQSVAQVLYDRIYTRFPTAVAWLHRKQEEAKNGVVTDYFGRPRKFIPGESYKARNFFIQSTAATFCQEKLVSLWKALDGNTAKLIFSVHDGYGMMCRLEKAKETFHLVKETLESESTLCPGLKLSVEIKFGGKLSDMRVLWK